MSQIEASAFATSADAKKAGHFSRRYKTNERHLLAKLDREARMDLKRDGAKQRAADAAAMSPKERIAHLDRLLGKGIGAKKERARLARRLAT